jgi:phosphopantothenoylcysteine synthetase/decarboxylase
MRRLTNASTGRLGSVLAEAMAAAGHRVLLFRGDLATAPLPSGPVDIRPFGTNDDLARALAEEANRGTVDAVFHAAALCDYRVASVLDAEGRPVSRRKIPSRSGDLMLRLAPATKVLPRLREWYPGARLVGWKYELDGDRQSVRMAALRQLSEARTDACVVNGRAWGPGFGLIDAGGAEEVWPDAPQLAAGLVRWLSGAEGATQDQSSRPVA